MPESDPIYAAPDADDLLIHAVLSGDAPSFESLMKRHNQRLFRAARSIVDNDADAEEAVQEAWFKAFTGLADFRSDARLSTWLTRIAINEALAVRRRNYPREQRRQYLSEQERKQARERTADLPPSMNILPEESVWRIEMRQILEERIQALPEKYRVVFMLRAVESLPSADVALLLDLPTSTVRVRFMRARRILQSALQQDIDTQSPTVFRFGGWRCDRMVSDVSKRLTAIGLR